MRGLTVAVCMVQVKFSKEKDGFIKLTRDAAIEQHRLAKNQHLHSLKLRVLSTNRTYTIPE